MWSNIVSVVTKSLIGIAPLIAHSYEEMLPKSHFLSTSTCSCFEILGYDVMIDDNLKVGGPVRRAPHKLTRPRPRASLLAGGATAGANRFGHNTHEVSSEAMRPA